MPARDADRIEVGPFSVSVSNPEKVLFPKSGITKREFVDYYVLAARYILPHVQGRPISMERFPDGVGGDRFFQKATPEYFPDFLTRVEIASEEGTSKLYTVIDNEASVVYLANLVTIPHIWMSRADALRRPDRLVWDLDPMGVGFDKVKVGAKLLRYLLGELGLACYPMLTGSRGIHVVAFTRPEADVDVVFQFTKDVAVLLARKLPQLFTATYTKSQRGRKIYLDYHRNVYAQTAVAPYAVRAREGAPAAVPILWEDVDDDALQANAFTVRNAASRLEEVGDAWGEVDRFDDLNAAREQVADLLAASRIAGT
jgi:bifunctional non-homologous end joining protein LigD